MGGRDGNQGDNVGPADRDLARQLSGLVHERQAPTVLGERGITKPKPEAAEGKGFDHRPVRQWHRYTHRDIHVSGQARHTVEDGRLCPEEQPLDADGRQGRPEVGQQVSDG